MYKEKFWEKYPRKHPYIGEKNNKEGLKRWFDEKWTNQRGEIGYKYKSDIYWPTVKITNKTPKTFSELTKSELNKARRKKSIKGRVNRF